MARRPGKAALLQGTLDMLILRTLEHGPAHGHDVSRHLRHVTDNVLHVEHGSLYPALHRLEAKGWVDAAWERSDKGKRARYYRLTRAGRKQLAAEQSRWEAFSRAMALLLAPAPEKLP